MNEPSLIGRQRTLLRDLVQLAAEKARSEPALAQSYRAARESAETLGVSSAPAVFLYHQ